MEQKVNVTAIDNDTSVIDVDVISNTDKAEVTVIESKEVVDYKIVSQSAEVVEVDVSEHNIVNPYTGTYEVTPMFGVDQELRTAGTTLARNVRVYEIPYSEIHNDKGMTLIVGE